MRRAISTFLFALSLLLTTVLVAMWARSYFILDEWSRVSPDNRTKAVCSYQGALHLIQCGTTSSPRPLTWDSQAIPPRSHRGNLHGYAVATWERGGFAQLAYPPANRIRPATGPILTVVGLLAPWLTVAPSRVYVIPYWAMTLVAAIPLLHWTWATLRTARRKRQGLCQACGYDLRASHERCPECGTRIAAAA